MSVEFKLSKFFFETHVPRYFKEHGVRTPEGVQVIFAVDSAYYGKEQTDVLSFYVEVAGSRHFVASDYGYGDRDRRLGDTIKALARGVSVLGALRYAQSAEKAARAARAAYKPRPCELAAALSVPLEARRQLARRRCATKGLCRRPHARFQQILDGRRTLCEI